MIIDYRLRARELPEGYAHQIRDFIRIHWFDPFTIHPEAEPLPRFWNPVHFITTEGKALYSHAAVTDHPITVNGRDYDGSGLGSVFTYPSFRGKGYGSRNVEAATRYIAASGKALSLLWTDPDKESFYGRFGWKHYANAVIRKGTGKRKSLVTYYGMILPLREDLRELLESGGEVVIDIGRDPW